MEPGGHQGFYKLVSPIQRDWGVCGLRGEIVHVSACMEPASVVEWDQGDMGSNPDLAIKLACSMTIS